MAEYEVAAQRQERALYQNIGFALAPLMALAIWLSPAPQGLPPEAWKVVGLAVWMAGWWVTEAVAIPATALLPLICLPVLGVATIKQAAAPFAHPVIALLFGGMVVALGLERWQLHRRLALTVLSWVGERPQALLLGFMGVTAFLSMWISNTASTMMMMPIALSVATVMLGDDALEGKSHPFVVALLLGIAYSASIGGLGTLIGTPANAMAAGYLRQSFGLEVNFLHWMMIGLPVVLLLIPAAWAALRFSFPFPKHLGHGSQDYIRDELRALGPMRTAEKRVSMVAVCLALAWISSSFVKKLPGLEGLDDNIIAIIAAVAMFVAPSGEAEGDGRLLEWKATAKLNWGVLLLFGGGLSLAAAMGASGLAEYLGKGLAGLADMPLWVLAGALVTMVVFLTELTSNTATAAALLPVLGALAGATGIDPVLLTVPAALAATCAFMMPVATGPNAIVFSAGRISVPQMAKAGFWLNIAAILVITPLGLALAGILAD